MNESDQRELNELKQRQQLLERQLDSLAADIRRLEERSARVPLSRLEIAQSLPDPTPPVEPVKQPPSPVPPPLPAYVKAAAAQPAAPVSIPPPTQPAREFVPEFVRQESPAQPSQTEAKPRSVPPVMTPPPVSEESKGSFEMRLGTYWLVRIGAVMILTGLVFFGNLAYQKMGPAGKVCLLYLASGLLLGFGAWWQRKPVKDSLKNYAQVLFAAGLAAVYFTTYAAYHLPTLRVIESALLDGLLLLGWAGFIVWIADRRKSELLALFATGLAYYTSIITPVTGFTLYSNVVLAVTTVFFLVRNRWAGLSWAGLIATYAAYAWWRVHRAVESSVQLQEGLWLGASFLFCYWVIFTVAVFLSKHQAIEGEKRAAFLTFNNGALFTLFLLTMAQVHEGEFWQFSLGFGAALLVMAELSRRFLSNEPITKNTYLTQGLILVTIGLISKFIDKHDQLALVLAAESVILFILGTLRRNIFLQTGAYISGAMAVCWGIDALERDERRAMWLGIALGALMAVNAFWAHWKMLWADKREVRPVPAYFILLALAMWIATTWFNTTTANFPLALTIEAVVLTASIYVVRMREFTILGKGLLILGLVFWLGRFVDATSPPPWWNPVAMIGMTLAVSHWWQRQKLITTAAGMVLQMFYAVALVALVLVWLEPKSQPGNWMLTTSLLALGVTAYGVLTRAWPLAACAQVFLVVSCGTFAWRLIAGKVEWYFPLAPVAVLSALSFATWQWFKRKPGNSEQVRTVLLQLALAYRWLAIGMSICWVNQYINEPERVWVFALMGLSAFFFAGWLRNREAMICSAAFVATGFATLWLVLPRADWVYFPNLLAVLA
ncbi:MAG TPA: DUF2339 domain-containing protein, partial [Verrucomicrobiae bacterium]|nr:DUF2339 domain-containing protein [Verrucomicrobiae bacterium]